MDKTNIVVQHGHRLDAQNHVSSILCFMKSQSNGHMIRNFELNLKEPEEENDENHDTRAVHLRNYVVFREGSQTLKTLPLPLLSFSLICRPPSHLLPPLFLIPIIPFPYFLPSLSLSLCQSTISPPLLAIFFFSLSQATMSLPL